MGIFLFYRNTLLIFVKQMRNNRYMNRIAAVVILTDRDNNLLLLNRNHSPMGFCLVGGNIDITKESIEEGLIREVEEEIGVKLKKSSLIRHIESEAIDKTKVYVYKINHSISHDIKLSSEHSGFLFTSTLKGIPLAGNTSKFIDGFQMESDCLDLNSVLNFGKYKNSLIRQIVTIDPQYILWVHNKTDNKIKKYILDSINKKIKEANDELEYIRWEEMSRKSDEQYRKNNLKESVETPYGRAISSNDGNYNIIDDEGNNTGKVCHQYYGWHKGSWGADL